MAIPEWVQFGKKQVKQQMTVIPRSTMVNQGPGPTDTVPAMLTPGEQVIPREMVQAAGGPQGVQQAINERTAPRGISMGGQPKAVGEDAAPQDQPAGYSSCGVRGYSTDWWKVGRTVLNPASLLIPSPKKIKGINTSTVFNPANPSPSVTSPSNNSPETDIGVIGGGPTGESLTTIPSNGNGVLNSIIPSAKTTSDDGVSVRTTSTDKPSTVAPTVKPGINIPGISQIKPTVTNPTTAQSSNQVPAYQPTAGTKGIVDPNKNYVQQQLENPFYAGLRQDAMEAMQKQQAAQGIVQNQRMAEAGIDSGSTIGRVGAAELAVGAEQAAGQAVSELNKDAMANIRSDAKAAATAAITAGDYEKANQLLADTGNPTIDFSKVDAAKRSENNLEAAKGLEELAKSLDPNDPMVQTLLGQSGKLRVQAYSLVGNTDFDPEAVLKGLDDLGKGVTDSPEATALYTHVLEPIKTYFTEDSQGQSDMELIKASTTADADGMTASDIVKKAMEGDEAAQKRFGAISRALFNNTYGSSTNINDYDRAILDTYGLYQNDRKKAGLNPSVLELEFADLSGAVAERRKPKGRGTHNDYWYLPKLEQALTEEKPISYDGVKYTVTGKRRKDDSASGTYFDYYLLGENGDERTITTARNNVRLI